MKNFDSGTEGNTLGVEIKTTSDEKDKVLLLRIGKDCAYEDYSKLSTFFAYLDTNMLALVKRILNGDEPISTLFKILNLPDDFIKKNYESGLLVMSITEHLPSEGESLFFSKIKVLPGNFLNAKNEWVKGEGINGEY